MANIVKQEFKLLQLRNTLPRIFGEMDNGLFEAILPLLEWKELPGKRYLFHQGDIGNSLYILISGRLQVVVKGQNNSEHIVGEIVQGETVGEMALFTGEPRTAGVVAVRDSVMVRLSQQAFEKIIGRYPNVVMNITKLLINRLKQRNRADGQQHQKGNTVFVPIGPGVEMDRFANRMAHQMARYGKTLHLSSQTVNRHFPSADFSGPLSGNNAYHRFSAWLDEQEALHDYLIYQADTEPTEWTKLCLRQADEIVLVANSPDTPVLSKAEKVLLHGDQKFTTATQTLVLLHPDGEQNFTGTSEWLNKREVQSHHHLRVSSDKDMERFVRYATGNAVGLVLSGGGAKGFAHIGVYKAMLENEIPVDMVGGTSMGALFGAAIAMQWPLQEILDATRSIFLNKPTPIWDYNFPPLVSLMNGRTLDRSLLRFMGGINIEDTMLNYYCLSSNLTQTKATVHQRGPLHLAIRASMSLPGILPPVIMGKNIHVDGGIFNNLPIDVMQELGAGHIAAVNLDPGRALEVDFEDIPNSWQIIKNRVTGNERLDVPTLMSTIIQSTTVNSDQKARLLSSEADLYFHPSLGQFGLMQWKAFNEIVETGYRHAMEVLENWEGFDMG